ncbi:hypothetical protein [Streptomyces sp. ALI-76-A]|jgi:hypothetical protein|nr:hypothetical protein [Streptomyces sp. ALI-76-A]MDL5202416.1 hypothetical protein [Streptomyces sp. ALI-76-A]
MTPGARTFDRFPDPFSAVSAALFTDVSHDRFRGLFRGFLHGSAV